MQDFRSIPGLSGRIFGGVAGGGADQLRRFGVGGAQEPPSAAAKCPRCESSNTKFCYYNNYNLSQPRHFCRSCRRYWTKGGVLRNVPVGGGCRKSSSSSSSSKKSSKNRRKSSPASNSSSDSSSLTSASNPSPELDPVGGSDPQPPPPSVIPGPEMFSEMGTFTSLMAAAAAGPAFLGFGFSDPPPPQLQQQMQPKAGTTEDFRMASGFIDQTADVDYPQHQLERRAAAGDGLDWNRTMEESVFDFAGAADPGAYWNSRQWDDADPSLFLP